MTHILHDLMQKLLFAGSYVLYVCVCVCVIVHMCVALQGTGPSAAAAHIHTLQLLPFACSQGVITANTVLGNLH